MSFLGALNKKAVQGRKKILRDERRLKSSRFNGRLIFSFLFWMVLVGVIFFTFQSWTRTGFLNDKVNGYQKKASAEIASLNEVGFANSPAGETYATQFIATYINVPNDEKGRAERAKSLQNFLGEGLKVGELENLSEFQGKRVLKSASLYDVKNVSEDAASYEFRIKYELFKVTDQDQSLGVKEQMIVIRLGTDGNSFNVIEQPYYQALPSESRIAAVQDQTDPSKKNVKVEDELKQFATQFFTSYTTNSTQEMSYLMENPESLKDQYEYKGMENFVVYDGKKDGQYIVKTLVLLQEANTGLQTKHPFTLVLSKQNNKFYVQELKHTLGG